MITSKHFLDTFRLGGAMIGSISRMNLFSEEWDVPTIPHAGRALLFIQTFVLR